MACWPREPQPTQPRRQPQVRLARNPHSPFKTREHSEVPGRGQDFSSHESRAIPAPQLDLAQYARYLQARHQLMMNHMRVMADHGLDTIVRKSVEHQPTLVKEGTSPPYLTNKGVPALNTFLVYVPSITVPSGSTADGLPARITFLGRPYSERTMLKLAYANENTGYRRPPRTTPAAARRNALNNSTGWYKMSEA